MITQSHTHTRCFRSHLCIQFFGPVCVTNAVQFSLSTIYIQMIKPLFIFVPVRVPTPINFFINYPYLHYYPYPINNSANSCNENAPLLQIIKSTSPDSALPRLYDPGNHFLTVQVFLALFDLFFVTASIYFRGIRSCNGSM